MENVDGLVSKYSERDRQLFAEVAKMMRGDFSGYETVYELSKRVVYSIIWSNTHNKEMTEDLMQDTYLQIYQKITTLQDPTKFLSWAGRIATNYSYRKMSNAGREVLGEARGDEDEGGDYFANLVSEDEAFIPEEVIENAEKRRMIQEVVDQLPLEQKTSVQYYYYEEMAVRDIAAAMGCTEGTVKSRLNYARKALKDAIKNIEVKQGTRLYSLGSIPVFWLVFRESAESWITEHALFQGVASEVLGQVKEALLKGQTMQGAGGNQMAGMYHTQPSVQGMQWQSFDVGSQGQMAQSMQAAGQNLTGGTTAGNIGGTATAGNMGSASAMGGATSSGATTAASMAGGATVAGQSAGGAALLAAAGSKFATALAVLGVAAMGVSAGTETSYMVRHQYSEGITNAFLRPSSRVEETSVAEPVIPDIVEESYEREIDDAIERYRVAYNDILAAYSYVLTDEQYTACEASILAQLTPMFDYLTLSGTDIREFVAENKGNSDVEKITDFVVQMLDSSTDGLIITAQILNDSRAKEIMSGLSAADVSNYYNQGYNVLSIVINSGGANYEDLMSLANESNMSVQNMVTALTDYANYMAEHPEINALYEEHLKTASPEVQAMMQEMQDAMSQMAQ